jgi:hypothetical protein
MIQSIESTKHQKEMNVKNAPLLPVRLSDGLFLVLFSDSFKIRIIAFMKKQVPI